MVLDHEEFPRANTTMEGLAKLEPSFAGTHPNGGGYRMKDGPLTFDQKAKTRYSQAEVINHVHTPGNSSGIVDGAGVVLLASPEYAKAHGLKPRARILQTATYGDEPIIMLTAPVPASKRVLQKAKMTANDIDLWEINEAFAAIPLKVMKDFGIARDKVNVNGGAIALGHPLGATGAMLLGNGAGRVGAARQDHGAGNNVYRRRNGNRNHPGAHLGKKRRNRLNPGCALQQVVNGDHVVIEIRSWTSDLKKIGRRPSRPGMMTSMRGR